MFGTKGLFKRGLIVLLCASFAFAGCGGGNAAGSDADSETANGTANGTTVETENTESYRVGGAVPDAFKPQEEEKYEEREMKISEHPFLKTEGKVLKDDYGKGELVQLKGTNVGGWLLQEFWMTSTDYSANATCEEDIYRILNERFGEEQTRELIKIYQDSFFTEEDLDHCRDLGMNCLRLPLWYGNLTDRNGNLLEGCWDRLDWFVEEAGKRGIYVLIDMHGAYGSQNGSDHSGKDGHDNKMEASEFFFGDEEVVKNNQELFYRLWEEIAAHFKGNPWVAGYDLLNEPFCTFRYNTGIPDRELRTMLWDIYDIAYDRIRAIDPDHIIIMEATWDPVDLPKPELYGWENVMYEYHNYLYDDYNNAAGRQISNMRKKLTDIKKADYNVPSLLGEFAFFDNPDAWDKGVKMINETGISWTTWTYKVIKGDGNWGLRHIKTTGLNLETADIETIKKVWSKGNETTENTTLKRVLTKYFKMIYLP
jgi:aryl-phospho-beta-D-glucosidase BglC (GH1 family)